MASIVNPILDAALSYAKRGWYVFPLRPNSKMPATKNGVKDASIDPALIDAWWGAGNPNDYGVAIACGRVSGIVALDIDPRHGGDETIRKLVQAGKPLPTTFNVRTPSTGEHRYYEYPEGVTIPNSVAKIGPGVDIRSDAGYVVAAPTKLEAGDYLASDLPVWECPSWIVDTATKPRNGKANGKPAAPPLDLRTEGARNEGATRVAGALRRLGLESNDIAAAIGAITSLPEEEVNTVAASIGAKPSGGDDEETTLAGTFAQQYRDKCRYNWTSNSWMVWKGHWWEADAGGKVRSLIFPLVDSNRKLEAIWNLARIPLGSKKIDWDVDPFLVGVLNGVVDLRTGDLSEGSPDQLIAKHIDLKFDPKATAPRWCRFVEEIFGNNQEYVDFFHRAIGYSLTGLTTEQCWFLCYGQGGNGKSTALQEILLSKVFGVYGAKARIETFTTRKMRSTITNDIAETRGRRFVVTSEPSQWAEIDEERIKDMTTGGVQRARFLRENEFEFRQIMKMWMETNHLPVVRDNSEGFWRRIRIFPFLQKFNPKTEPDLVSTLEREAEGILTWCVEGAVKYLQSGLNVPADNKTWLEDYRTDEDELGWFVDGCLEQTNNQNDHISTSDMYRAYKKWAMAEGNREGMIKGPNAFARMFKDRFPTHKGRSASERYWSGFKFKEDGESDNF